MNHIDKQRILIAEDDGLVGTMIAAMLAAEGYEILAVVGDGAAAVEATVRLTPDAVVMDKAMPRLDGIKATHVIQATQPTPVVMLTAYETPELIQQATNAGVGAYLVKPSTGPSMNCAITNARARFEETLALQRLAEALSSAEHVVPEPLNMAEIVATVRQRLSRLWAEYETEIAPPSEWPTAQGYPPWVEDLWVVYLSSALHHDRRPQRLELGADTDEDIIRFWVRRDESTPEHKAKSRLFVPYLELAQVRGEDQEPGRTILEQVTEKLGGETGIEHQPGQELKFWFSLPAAR